MDNNAEGRPDAAAAGTAFFLGGADPTSTSSPLASRFLRLSLLFRLDLCSFDTVTMLGAGEVLDACASVVLGTLGAGEFTPEETPEETTPCWVDAMA